MSLWHCPKHGLYGGDVFCPQCGENGSYVTIETPSRPDPAIEQERIDRRWRAFDLLRTKTLTYGDIRQRLLNWLHRHALNQTIINRRRIVMQTAPMSITINIAQIANGFIVQTQVQPRVYSEEITLATGEDNAEDSPTFFPDFDAVKEALSGIASEAEGRARRYAQQLRQRQQEYAAGNRHTGGGVVGKTGLGGAASADLAGERTEPGFTIGEGAGTRSTDTFETTEGKPL